MLNRGFEATPEDALRAVSTHRGAVLVDFDETLYLHNSTEDFIGSAWPGPLAYLVMRILELLRPWRLTGGVRTRDVWRVAVIRLLFPWTLWAWRRRAPSLARAATNVPLARALNGCDQPKAVVTLGFRPIVEPLVAAMGLRNVRILAMNPWRFDERAAGKQAMVAKAIGQQEVCNALLVTDSLDDLDLLQACLEPLHVVWPEAAYREAFHQVYIPGMYTSRVKRPGMKYIYRGIVSDEYSLWILASIPLVTQPGLHIVGLALLCVSFWAIYETGYVDNDVIGARHETHPKLTRQFFEGQVRRSTVLPWVWAAACGIVALVLLRWPMEPLPSDALAWTAVLLLTHFWFRLYNRVDKRSRIWLFAGLQAFRAASFVAVVSVTLVGAAALVAHILARWVPYYAYRVTGTEYNVEAIGTSRLLFFVLIAGGAAAALGWDAVWSLSGLVLLGWLAFKARRELMGIAQNVHWISNRPPAAKKAGARQGTPPRAAARRSGVRRATG